MTRRLLLPVSELPGEIRESLRSALNGANVKLSHGGIYLDGDELEAALDRIARNVAQSLFAIDEGGRDDLSHLKRTVRDYFAALDRRALSSDASWLEARQHCNDLECRLLTLSRDDSEAGADNVAIDAALASPTIPRSVDDLFDDGDVDSDAPRQP